MLSFFICPIYNIFKPNLENYSKLGFYIYFFPLILKQVLEIIVEKMLNKSHNNETSSLFASADKKQSIAVKQNTAPMQNKKAFLNENKNVITLTFFFIEIMV